MTRKRGDRRRDRPSPSVVLSKLACKSRAVGSSEVIIVAQVDDTAASGGLIICNPLVGLELLHPFIPVPAEDQVGDGNDRPLAFDHSLLEVVVPEEDVTQAFEARCFHGDNPVVRSRSPTCNLFAPVAVARVVVAGVVGAVVVAALAVIEVVVSSSNGCNSDSPLQFGWWSHKHAPSTRCLQLG